MERNLIGRPSTQQPGRQFARRNPNSLVQHPSSSPTPNQYKPTVSTCCRIALAGRRRSRSCDSWVQSTPMDSQSVSATLRARPGFR
ncbi:hypothetical protein N7510_007303 [Penicillium lagena]|uniref:uncharacterized protein n=1 Tax=Penicillium lagena TaxID=94218 RepID=UPI00253FB618|nr:uncharacterized protein N7510_007303 [Penicillium lagena]KAJ5610584.1 hypothetical protein N7510_007303 [Penicillium lagena]